MSTSEPPLLYTLPPREYCVCQLHKQHDALHYIWQAIRDGRTSEHPEIARWADHQYALVVLHCQMVGEFLAWGIRHTTSLPHVSSLVLTRTEGPLILPLDEQRAALFDEPCVCEGVP